MGHPQNDPELFGSWAMGAFGPFVFPGNLVRAAENNFNSEWAQNVAAKHKAFIRIKLTYAVGKNATILPPGYNSSTAPLEELAFLTDIAGVLLSLPQALAYFNPNGEVLMNADSLERSVAHYAKIGLPAMTVWTNVRYYHQEENWSFMDVIGMEQLFMRDHEACFITGKYDLDEIANFLRNVAEHIRQKGPVIKPGDVVRGPGKIDWRAMHCDKSLCIMPRPVIRWFPQDGTEPPKSMLVK